MQVQAQLNRILRLSQETGSFRRLQRAANVIERDRDYKVYTGDKLSVLTKNQSNRVEGTVTHQGRKNAIARAAAGGSAG